MRVADCIRSSLVASDFAVDSYLKDLTDEDLLVRPVPGANHIAWQLGHLILSEGYIVERCAGGEMPPLPEGFAVRYGRENNAAASDSPSDFLSKDEYLQLRRDMRAQTLKVVDSLSDADFDREVSRVPPFLKTVGECLLFIGTHWTVHAGQWVIVRRKLGRPPLF